MGLGVKVLHQFFCVMARGCWEGQVFSHKKLVDAYLDPPVNTININCSTSNKYHNCAKNGTVWFHNAVMHPKDTHVSQTLKKSSLSDLK